MVSKQHQEELLPFKVITWLPIWNIVHVIALQLGTRPIRAFTMGGSQTFKTRYLLGTPRGGQRAGSGGFRARNANPTNTCGWYTHTQFRPFSITVWAGYGLIGSRVTRVGFHGLDL